MVLHEQVIAEEDLEIYIWTTYVVDPDYLPLFNPDETLNKVPDYF